jgi:hypothetical protein
MRKDRRPKRARTASATPIPTPALAPLESPLWLVGIGLTSEPFVAAPIDSPVPVGEGDEVIVFGSGNAVTVIGCGGAVTVVGFGGAVTVVVPSEVSVATEVVVAVEGDSAAEAICVRETPGRVGFVSRIARSVACQRTCTGKT